MEAAVDVRAAARAAGVRAVVMVVVVMVAAMEEAATAVAAREVGGTEAVMEEVARVAGTAVEERAVAKRMSMSFTMRRDDNSIRRKRIGALFRVPFPSTTRSSAASTQLRHVSPRRDSASLDFIR